MKLGQDMVLRAPWMGSGLRGTSASILEERLPYSDSQTNLREILFNL